MKFILWSALLDKI